MTTRSYLNISCFKDGNTAVNINPSCFSFMTDCKKLLYKSKAFDLLKYLDNEANLDVSKMYSRFEKFIDEIPMISLKEPIGPFDHWIIKQPVRVKELFNYDIITTLTIISRIMNTPFQINNEMDKWTIWAKLDNGVVYLFTENIDDERTIEMAKHFKLLQNYLFVRKPESLHRQVISPLYYHYYQVYNLTVGNNKIIYPGEVFALNSVQMVTDGTQLATAEHVYCDIFEEGKFSQEIINYNPIWWSKALLLNAKQCFIGVYNKQEARMKNILNFNLEDFNDTSNYENLWTPKAAKNFLNKTLEFIKFSINNVQAEYRNDCVWKIQSYVNSDDYITCEPLIRQALNDNLSYIPLPQHCLLV